MNSSYFGQIAKKPIVFLSLIATTTIAAVGIGAPAASAEERSCRGTIGAITVDNLRVPQGESCVLQGTKVKGTIKVERAASLQASKVSVVGNVQGENARAVLVGNSTIGGSYQVVQGRNAGIVHSIVQGGILLDDNTRGLTVRANRVNDSIQVFQNTGGVKIESNRVDGNLQCKENAPAPTGGGNIVQGNKEDQCASL